MIQAQYYPKLSQIEFCVCDCGKGIKRSLEETDSQGFSSDLDAIAAALALRNRNESEDGAGLGLAALATYIRKSSNGTFTIRTGDAIKTLKRNTVTATEQLEYWQGTIITLRLNVEDDTDLSQIWERMAR